MMAIWSKAGLISTFCGKNAKLRADGLLIIGDAVREAAKVTHDSQVWWR